jgi:3-hydroxyisobutyrate dehydrogenase
MDTQINILDQHISLQSVEENCWSLLHGGAYSRKSAMHQATIATAVDGMALMRTVVLRRVDMAGKRLFLHTDLRSKKIKDFESGDSLSWLFYDQSVATQIRLSGKVILHHQDTLCREHWDKTGHHSRRYYMSDTAPSVAFSDPFTGLNPALTSFAYTLEESEKGFENFVVVETEINWMEWYYTHHTGNRRAVFRYLDGSLHEATWLSP